MGDRRKRHYTSRVIPFDARCDANDFDISSVGCDDRHDFIYGHSDFDRLCVSHRTFDEKRNNGVGGACHANWGNSTLVADFPAIFHTLGRG